MLKLGYSEQVVLRCLQREAFVSRAALFATLYGNRPDGGPDSGFKVVDQWIFRLRRKMRAAGVRLKIETQHGQGYRLVCG